MSDTPPTQTIRCVLVGDASVGKTAMVISYTRNGFPTEYVPTAFDNYAVVVTVNEEPIQLELCDTPGQNDFDQLRTLCYPSADAFLLCFSVASPQSFRNITRKWLPELRTHRPALPIVLVATQLDLRNDVKILIELANYGEKPISEPDGRKLMRDYRGIVSYIECSALTQQNLKEVFDRGLLAALVHRQSLESPVTDKHAFISSMFSRKISLPLKAVKQTENNNGNRTSKLLWKQSTSKKQTGKRNKKNKGLWNSYSASDKDGGREYWSDGDDWLNKHRTDLYKWDESSGSIRNKSASNGKFNTVGSRLGAWSMDRNAQERKQTNGGTGSTSEAEWANLSVDRVTATQSLSRNHSCRSKQYAQELTSMNQLSDSHYATAERRPWWRSLSCCFA